MNQSIFFFFYNLAHQSQVIDNIVVFFAVWFPYIVIFSAGVFLLMHHEVFRAESTWQVFLQKKKEILNVFFDGAIAWVLAYVFKFLLHFPRPFDAFSQVRSLISESGYAFPSGHATFFMALAVSILFFHKKAGYIFMFCALLIGLARIVAGVHFPVDILAGFVLGALVSLSINKIKTRLHLW